MPRTLFIQHDSDEGVTILLGASEVIRVDHDRHGWAGMEAAEKVARELARLAGWHVEDTYPEGIDAEEEDDDRGELF
jgi:hypothetical protein